MTLSDARYRGLLLGVVALGAVLRLAVLNWDAGRGLHPDEGNLVRAALALGPGGRFIPEFHAYNDLALWLPRLLSLPVCAPGDASCLTLVARLVSALMSVATLPLAADVARRLAGEEAGLAAAAVFAVSVPLIQWAHFGTTESALVLLVMALWALVLRAQAGATSRARLILLSGALIGLGIGFKTTALALGLIPVAGILLSDGPLRLRLQACLGVGVMAVAVGLIVTPSLWAVPGDWLAVMRFEGRVVSGAQPVFWTAQFHEAVPGWFELTQVWIATQGAGLLLAGLGLAVTLRRGWRGLAAALVFGLIYGALILGWQAKFFRYLAPLLPIVLVLAGLGLGHLLTGRAGRSARALGLGALGLMALAGVDHAASHVRPDPRIAAERLVTARAGPGARVAVEPHDLAQTGTLDRLTLPLTAPDTGPEALAEVLAQADWLILASRRNWSVLPQHPGAPPVICAYYARLAAGGLGFVRIASLHREGPFGHLFRRSLRAEETQVVFDRPEVFVFRNAARLSAPDLAARLAEPADPAACEPDTLLRQWRRPS
ncbi:MAG: DUF2029 domain-containing protein [Rhodobacteraceae bacterium]|nr:MAG: DUF2029 domain-containing protein [Paracoccaceae bacterium]